MGTNSSTSVSDYIKTKSSDKRILMLFSDKADYDSVSSMIALKKFLEVKQNCSIDVGTNKEINTKIRYLLDRYGVKYEKKLEKPQYIIKIRYGDEDGTEIDNVRYEADGEDLFLYITPLRGRFDFDRVTFEQKGATYDSIFLFGVNETSFLEPLYSANLFLFDNVDSINITKEDSVSFGNIILSSHNGTISGTVFEMLRELGLDNLDTKEEVVKVLTEGVLYGLNICEIGDASVNDMKVLYNLTSLGGNIKTAFKNVYTNYSSGSFSLYSKTYENATFDETGGLGYSVISNEDVLSTVGKISNIDLTLPLIFSKFDTCKIGITFYQGKEDNVIGIVETYSNTIDARELVQDTVYEGNARRVIFTSSQKSFTEVQNTILGAAKANLGITIVTSTLDNTNKVSDLSDEGETDSSLKRDNTKEIEGEKDSNKSKDIPIVEGDISSKKEKNSTDGLVSPPPVE